METMVIGFVMMCSIATAATPDDKLWYAITMVESGGNPNVRPGDNGQSVGIAQIKAIMVKDCNRIAGRTKWSLKDRHSPRKSREMFNLYCNTYSKGSSYELMAKRWNQGPKWNRSAKSRRNAAIYWQKVKKYL